MIDRRPGIHDDVGADRRVGLDDGAGEQDRAGAQVRRRMDAGARVDGRDPLDVPELPRQTLPHPVLSYGDDGLRLAGVRQLGDGPDDGEPQDRLSPPGAIVVQNRRDAVSGGLQGADDHLRVASSPEHEYPSMLNHGYLSVREPMKIGIVA
jgi:hypothetical protein